jgi:hypothetical protein
MTEGASSRLDAVRARWMGVFFALGSACFLVGPMHWYLHLVGDTWDAITFFVGSLLFTGGGALQSLLAWPERHQLPKGRAAWRTAWIQSVGTLFFNVTTFQALSVPVANTGYDRLVWRPDALGSVCFLISGTIGYLASSRRGWLPARTAAGWWEPAVNLLGCVLFGISAVAGYVVPTTGSMLDLAAANWNTSLGALCFFACAIWPLVGARTFKIARLQELREVEHTIEHDVEEIV